MTLRKRKNSLRLSGYDYSQSGMYFVTIIAYKRLHLFGSIENSIVTISKLGDIITSCWRQIPDHFSSVELGAFVIMPNHVHGVIILHSSSEKVTLGHVINTFKGAVTRIARKTELDFDLEHPVWHRNFHDRIIRNEQEYNYIVQYVHSNPSRWEADTFYE
jgi:REP-associated tyrosine transposase